MGLGGAAGAHFTNFPLASRHGAASAGVDNIAIDVAASIIMRIIDFLPPLIRRDKAKMIALASR